MKKLLTGLSLSLFLTAGLSHSTSRLMLDKLIYNNFNLYSNTSFLMDNSVSNQNISCQNTVDCQASYPGSACVEANSFLKYLTALRLATGVPSDPNMPVPGTCLYKMFPGARIL